MDLIVLKNTAATPHYAVNSSAVAITDIANIATLADGSFAIADLDGTIFDSGYTNAASLANDCIIYYKSGGELRRSVLFDRKASKLTEPISRAAAAQVFTQVLSFGVRDAAGQYTGVVITDVSRDVEDPFRTKVIELFVNSDTVLDTYGAALATEIAKHEAVASAVYTAGTDTLVVTAKAGRNLAISGEGYMSHIVKFTVSTPLAYVGYVTATELAELAVKVAAAEGKYDNHMSGAPAMFSKTYNIESSTNYDVYSLEVKRPATYPTNSADVIPQQIYIAIPNGVGAIPLASKTYLAMLQTLVA